MSPRVARFDLRAPTRGTALAAHSQVAPHPSPGDSQISPGPPLGLPPGVQGASAPPDSPPPAGHAEDLMLLAK